MTSTAACIISQPKDVPSTEKQLHSIPSKIQYTGPADIDGYFIEEKGEDGSLRAAFRGRGLEGCQVQAPEGYHICVLKERLTSGATGPRRFDVVDRQSNFTFWEWDREAGANSQAARALAALKLAKALAED